MKKSPGRPRRDPNARTLPPEGVRFTPAERDLIGHAADASGKTRQEIIREGAIREATRQLKNAKRRDV